MKSSCLTKGAGPPCGGHRGGQWRGARDDFPHQPPGVERAHDWRALPLPLADRSLLQATQADLASGRLPGQQRQRGQVAVVDGPAADAPAALPGPPFQMEPQLCAAFHPHSIRFMEPLGLAGPAPKLWDSRREFSMFGPARAGLFARNLEIQWDSQAAKADAKPEILRRKNQSTR